MYDMTPTTPLDLNLRLLGFSIRVHPLFWLTLALLGRGIENPQHLLIWVFAGFISILCHELGHALVGRFFGADPYIVLVAFGGYAANATVSTPWRNIAVVAAGPAVSFLTGGIGVGCGVLLALYHDRLPFDAAVIGNLAFFFECLAIQGIVWGIFNLLPVYPLDGGQMLRYFLTRYRPWDGVRISLQVSMITAVLIGAVFLNGGSDFGGLMMLFMAYNNWQEYQWVSRG